MATESREEILSEFQKCTGLENLEECIYILDQHEWNLQEAVHEILEKIGSSFENEMKTDTQTQLFPHGFGIDENQQLPLNVHQQVTTAARELHFSVDFAGEHFDLINFDNNTILDLKHQIFEKTQLPIDQQQFLNWSDKIYSDLSFLRDLHLPKENQLFLIPKTEESTNFTQITTAPIASSPKDDYPLNIRIESNSGITDTKCYTFKTNTTIQEIKTMIATIATIPEDEQIWTGLNGANDQDKLSQTKISQRAQLSVRSKNSTKDSMDGLMNSDEHMDTDFDFDNVTLNQQPLIPEDCSDDITALEHFSQIFHNRYNSTCPILYRGSLDQAIQESLYKSIIDRRPLAVYIHNDRSVCANIFCLQVLAADSIVEYLSNNYTFWAWDITLQSNLHRLNEVIRRCSATQCFDRIETSDSDTFPLLILLTRNRGTLDVMDVIEGKSTAMEVISRLIQAHESFEEQRNRDMEEELSRERREQLKQQQEDEYSRSIAADLEKQRLKLDDERRQREEYDANERLKEERLKKQEQYLSNLPTEPKETEQNITTIKIRLPDGGGILMRRFFINDKIELLFNYLNSQGQMFGEYKLLTTYPKRDITNIDPTNTFEQLKLYPQEQLFLESL